MAPGGEVQSNHGVYQDHVSLARHTSSPVYPVMAVPSKPCLGHDLSGAEVGLWGCSLNQPRSSVVTSHGHLNLALSKSCILGQFLEWPRNNDYVLSNL